MTQSENPSRISRGAFIVFEGLDRSGKSTQCEKLASFFKSSGEQVVLFKFPNRSSTTGKVIQAYLQGTTADTVSDEAIHLLFSANRWEAMKEIRELLEQGVTCIADRYAFSGVAYSSAKGLDLNWCMSPDRGLLSPDMVFFMDLPPSEAAKRGDYGNEVYERVEFQEKVYNMFHKVMNVDGDSTRWKVVDANRDQESIFKDVLEECTTVLKACETTEIKMDLWK